MATNLAIDDELIVEAQAIGGARTKKAVVTEALKETFREESRSRLFPCSGKWITIRITTIRKPDHANESTC